MSVDYFAVSSKPNNFKADKLRGMTFAKIKNWICLMLSQNVKNSYWCTYKSVGSNN